MKAQWHTKINQVSAVGRMSVALSAVCLPHKFFIRRIAARKAASIGDLQAIHDGDSRVYWLTGKTFISIEYDPIDSSIDSFTLTGLSASTLTLDNGTEFAAYKAMGVDVFFADPGRPRQRSRNENTNGLIRQYVPKAARLSKLSSAKIRRIETRLNHRPRKTLGYKTHHEVLFNQTPTPVAVRT